MSCNGMAEAATRQLEDGPVVAVLEAVRHLVCGVQGHDYLLRFERDRMYLKCLSCGHESPGWELPERRPTVTARAEPSSSLSRPRLLHARRIA